MWFFLLYKGNIFIYSVVGLFRLNVELLISEVISKRKTQINNNTWQGFFEIKSKHWKLWCCVYVFTFFVREYHLNVNVRQINYPITFLMLFPQPACIDRIEHCLPWSVTLEPDMAKKISLVLKRICLFPMSPHRISGTILSWAGAAETFPQCSSYKRRESYRSMQTPCYARRFRQNFCAYCLDQVFPGLNLGRFWPLCTRHKTATVQRQAFVLPSLSDLPHTDTQMQCKCILLSYAHGKNGIWRTSKMAAKWVATSASSAATLQKLP